MSVLIESFTELRLPHEFAQGPTGGGATVVVELPGEHKLRIPVAFTVGAHSVTVNAFVIRAPDEHADAVHRWLLRRNQRLYAVAYAIDHLGDVYLVARLPAQAFTPATVDEILGSIAATADADFDVLLRMGFESAIRAEWRWRLSRGESTRNLAAFSDLAPDATKAQDTAGFGHDR